MENFGVIFPKFPNYVNTLCVGSTIFCNAPFCNAVAFCNSVPFGTVPFCDVPFCDVPFCMSFVTYRCVTYCFVIYSYVLTSVSLWEVFREDCRDLAAFGKMIVIGLLPRIRQHVLRRDVSTENQAFGKIYVEPPPPHPSH